MKIYRAVFFALLVITLTSCGADDNILDTVQTVPPRPLTEVAIEDDVELVAFLETHFYNDDEFANPPAGFDFKIQIDTIEGDNAARIPLIDQVVSETINVNPNIFNITEQGDNVPHTFYYLIARRGLGDAITTADSTFVRFEGYLLNESVFQPENTFPIWRDLPGTNVPGEGGQIQGFREGVSKLISGSGITTNANGSISSDDYGVGAIFMPSGLGFSNGVRPGIPAFSPIVFEIDLFLAIPNTDHDQDGIPSSMEDINQNNDVRDDNTDNDIIGVGLGSNYLDVDDDNDGILTRDEIIINDDGSITFPDTDGDGTPDYLDADS